MRRAFSPSVGFVDSLWSLLAAALSAVMPLDRPADRALNRFFHEHHAGSRHRRLVSQLVFEALRYKNSLALKLAADDSAEHMALALLVSANFWPESLSYEQQQWAQDFLAEPPSPPSLDYPAWLWQLWQQQYQDEAEDLAQALLQEAPLDIRINPLNKQWNRRQVSELLEQQGLDPVITPMSPFGLRLYGRPNLYQHELISTGAVEVQDEASQLSCLLMPNQRSHTVVDLCAGAGGKTLLLGALMANTGRLWALDNSPIRLERAKPRIRRAGLSNVVVEQVSNQRLKRLRGKVDGVFVDAPCSGSGTLRRNPDLKWRMAPANLQSLCLEQAQLLDTAAALLKPGGHLVYCTCSVLAQENQEQITAFLGRHPGFVLHPLPRELIGLGSEHYLELLPHRHGTDGFFGACLEKQA